MTAPNPARMTCPRCAASTIAPDTGACEGCGHRPDASMTVAGVDALMEKVTRQLSDEFDVVEIVGRRAGTLVLRAIEKNRGREVLLKVVQRRNDDPGADARFRSVLETFQRLDHPHLVPILRFGSTDNLLWLTTPDTGAKPLREHLTSAGRLELRTACGVATQLTSALEYLHRQGLVHGAVKAENILVDPQGWAWLADPAFARPLPPPRRTPPQGTKSGAPSEVPTVRPPWMAPEDVARAERLPTSDQFGLAAVLFEAIAGDSPREPGKQIVRFRTDVPLAMSNALARALDAQPSRRFPSCTDFLVALNQAGLGGTANHRPSGRISADMLLMHDWEPLGDPAKPTRKTRGVLFGLVLVIALALAAPTLLGVIQNVREPRVASAPSAPLVVAPSAVAPPPSAPRTVESAETPAAPRTEPRTVQQERPRVPPSSFPRPAARPAAPTTLPPVVEAARLTINASPWGQVFIDDVLIGNTPRANIEVAAGEHVIRVSRQGFSTFTRTIRLQPGESLRITDIVLTPVAP